MTTVEEPSAQVSDPGWFPDPYDEHELRYFDGSTWTDHVTHHGPKPCKRCHPTAPVDPD